MRRGRTGSSGSGGLLCPPVPACRYTDLKIADCHIAVLDTHRTCATGHCASGPRCSRTRRASTRALVGLARSDGSGAATRDTGSLLEFEVRFAIEAATG